MDSRPSPPSNALAWALLSQAIWLPLLGIDLHDRWQSQLRQQREIAEASLRLSPQAPMSTGQRSSAATAKAGTQATTGLLLGSASSSPLNPADRTAAVRESGEGAQGPARPLPAAQGEISADRSGPVGAAEGVAPGAADQPLGPSATTPGWRNPMLRTFNRAELLGGSIGLRDLNNAPMPPLAMAERARWQRSGDPLAPLPEGWREPMRQALHGLAASKGTQDTVTAARVIHVPSLRVRQSTAVPLAVQADGSVDILTKPDNPAVVEEIRQWSARQSASKQSGVTAAVVHLEPLPEAPRPSQEPLTRAGAAPAPSRPAPVVTSSRAVADPAPVASPAAVVAAPAPEAAPPPAAPVPAAAMAPAASGATLP